MKLLLCYYKKYCLPLFLLVLINQVNSQDIDGITEEYLNDFNEFTEGFVQTGNRVESKIEYFEKYNGKIVRNIDVEVFDVFGYSISDSTKKAHSFFQKSANYIHINSFEKVVKQKVYLEENRPFSAWLAIESEVYLRSKEYIYDAKIDVIPIDNSDSIDVKVLVQDVWSLKIFPQLNLDKESGKLIIFDENFAGLGATFYNRFNYNRNGREKTIWDGYFQVDDFIFRHNIFKVSYTNEEKEKSLAFSSNREYFSPLVKFTGGVNYEYFDSYRIKLDEFNSEYPDSLEYEKKSIWGGYNYLINPLKDVNDLLIFTAGVEKYNYYKTYKNNDGYYQDGILPIISVGYMNRHYFSDSHVFKMGVQEDIPLVELFTITTGYYDGKHDSYPYFGMKATKSEYYNGLGYLYWGIKAGGFLNSGKWKNGVFILDFYYISRLYRIIGNKSRFHASFEYSKEIGYFEDGLELKGKAIDAGDYKGNRKLFIRFEEVTNIPLTFWELKFALVGFSEFALFTPRDRELWSSSLYSGLGAGLRVSSKHRFIEYLEFNYGFYDNNLPGDEDGSRFTFSTKITNIFNSIKMRKPQILKIEQ